MRFRLHIFSTAVCFLFLLTLSFGQGQAVITIASPAVTVYTNTVVVARDAIFVQPKTTFSVTAGNESRLYIDKTIQLPATYDPGGVHTSNFTVPDIDYNLPVGTISGSGNVTSSGQGTYNIPIVLPPGTNGMAPSLGISYNSGSSDGLLGRGWNISGVSSIMRVPKTIYHDNVRAGVQLNSSDVYALDGNRIIGTHLENDNFSQVIFNSSSNSYTVRTKDGTTMEYGNTPESKLMAGIPNVVVTWFLNKVKDNYGNYVSYIYDNNAANREVVLKEIQYTGNAAAGIQPYNSVKFYYDIRTDATTRYILNNAFKSTLILREIEMNCESKFVKRFQFQYAYDSQTFLNSITEQGSDYSKLNTTYIMYGDNVTQSNTVVSSQPTGLTANADYVSGDFNGDGKSDLVAFTYSQIFINGTKTYTGWELYINQDDGTTFNKIPNSSLTQLPANFFPFSLPDFMSESSYSFPSPFGMQVVDFNSDGKDDILIGFYAGGVKNFRVYYATGNNFTQGTNTFFTENNYSFTLIDVDGDSKVEGVTFDPTGPSFRVYSFETGTWSYITSFNPVISPNYQGLSTTDFDGDGIQELVTVRGSLLVVLKLNMVPATSTELYTSILPSVYRQNYLGDFNGDGIIDNVKVDDPSGTAIATQWLGTGTGFSVSSTMNGVTHFSSVRKYITADINNDGKTDFIEVSKTATPDIRFNVSYGGDPTLPRTLLGSLSSMSFPDVIDYIYDDPNDPNYPPDYQTNPNLVPEFLTGDFDGDGRADIFFKTSNNGQRVIAYINKSSTKHLASSITNGFRVNSNFKYATLANGGPQVYLKGTGAVFPIADFQFPIYVAKEFSTMDGLGGNNITAYKYEGATVHLQGKGLLGFNQITATTNSNTTPFSKTISTYTLNPTYIEKVPSKTETYSYVTPNFILRREETYTFAFSSTGGKAHFTVIDKTESWDHVSHVKTTVDPVYDSNANITMQTTTIDPCGYGTPIETTVVEMPTYTNAGSWLPNVPDTRKTTITRAEDAAAPYVRNVSYFYNTTTGALDQTINDPNALDLKRVVTDYTYFSGTGVLKTHRVSSPETDAGYLLPQKTVEYTYDLPYQRFVTQTKNPLGQFSYASYDPKWGKPLTETDISGLVTKYTYDGYGRNVSVTTPDNLTSTTTFGWAKSGAPGAPVLADYTPTTFDSYITSNALYSITFQRPGSPDSKTIYDIHGRELATETEGFSGKLFSANKYDARGNIEKACGGYQSPLTLAAVITTNTYNDLNLITSTRSVSANITTPPATTIAYTYSPPPSDEGCLGRTTITTTSPDGKVFSKTNDASGLLISAQDAGGTLTYNYYSNRQLKQTLLNGIITNTIEYDDLGRQKKLTEANSGITEYKYNAYGELFYQKDANGNESKFQYNDVLGRMTAKTCTTATSIVDTYGFSYVSNGNGLNQLQSITGPGNISYSYTYDNLSRVIKEDQNINGPLFSTSYEYDAFGNVAKQTYPSGFAIKNSYNENGYHTQINKADDNALIYRADEMSGKFNKYTLGNGIQTVKTYTDFGFPTSFVATGVQDLSYSFNQINGNLDLRTDAIAGLTESFTYDNLDRLKTTSGINGISVNYSSNGNILNKLDAGAGNYVYDPVKINALVKIPDPDLTNINSTTQNISYTPFNKAQTITEGSFQLDFIYGPDKQRKVTTLLDNSVLQSTRYFSGDYEKTITGSITTEVHYISSNIGLVGMYVITNGAGAMYYPYTDHLGSILKVTDATGTTIVANQSFDAWGRNRNPIDWSYSSIPSVPIWLYRGFTMHEHLREFALINMNGRMYDPVVGRMLSVDRNAANGFSQHLNRYSYAFNNPLKFTDPKGEWVWVAVGAVVGGVINVAMHWDQITAGGKFHWGEFGVAFGIGAVAGAVATVTGGAAISSLGLAGATSVGGLTAAGAIGGFVGSASSSLIMGIGNNVAFGDPYSGKQFLRDVVIGTVVGTAIGYTIGKFFTPRPGPGIEPTPSINKTPIDGDVPTPKLQIDKLVPDEIPGKPSPGTVYGPDLEGIKQIPSGKYVVAPDGQTIRIPENYYSTPANNGNGIVYRPIGTPPTSNANSIRIMGPTSYAPNGYAVYYNASGQPINPSTGQTLSKAEWHFLFGK